MLARILTAALLLAAGTALVPSASAIRDPHLPCYPDFYGGTVCVVGEEPAPCFTLVSHNPDPRHPQHPVHVSPVYCRNADGTNTQMTPCLDRPPLVATELDPYCWTTYPEDP